MNKTINQTNPRRFSLQLPDALFDDIEEIAVQERISITDIIRDALKMWLFVRKSQDAGSMLFLRTGAEEIRIIILK